MTTYYVWDTENPTGYPQVVEEIENNQVVRRYGYGHFLENVDIWNGTAFERFYVVRDGTNSVRILLDSAGNVVATYDYDAFGYILSSTLTNPICSQNNYQFHSEYRDPTTGLVYLRERWYEPREGRFLCKDEFEGTREQPMTLNKYVSFNDNPVNLIDPLGSEGIIGPTGDRISELLKGVVNVNRKFVFLGESMVPALFFSCFRHTYLVSTNDENYNGIGDGSEDYIEALPTENVPIFYGKLRMFQHHGETLRRLGTPRAQKIKSNKSILWELIQAETEKYVYEVDYSPTGFNSNSFIGTVVRNLNINIKPFDWAPGWYNQIWKANGLQAFPLPQ